MSQPNLEKLQSLELSKEEGEPTIKRLMDDGQLLAIDFAAAQYIGKNQDVSEANLLLFSFLFAAARLGHLCVIIDQKIHPCVSQVWTIDDEKLLKDCQTKLRSSFQALGDSYFSQAPNIKKISNRLYLQKNIFYEEQIYKYYQKLESSQPSLKIENLKLNEKLTGEQKSAVSQSLLSSLSFIIGGPGVGKTFTASALIEIFLTSFPDANVAVVAPTGKAVANLQEGLAKLFEKQTFNLVSCTLHKLFYKPILSFLPYDLILIDESSMVDAYFYLKLLKYCKPRSRLIFLGDPNQLPPVGSGSIFKDLLRMSSSQCFLNQCLRTEIQDIVDSSHLVRKGDVEGFLKVVYLKKLLKDLPSKNELLDQLISKIPQVDNRDSDYQKLKTFLKYKILTSMKKGEYGADFLNQSIRQLLAKKLFHPILITANDYQLELYNGDMGILTPKGEVIFFSRHSKQKYTVSHEGVRRIPVALLPSYEWAYCLSIHKSQGSEYEKISIIVSPKSENFGRELLYTAITRAKKEFEVFSDKHTLQKLVKNRCVRVSGLNLAEDG
ncbi:MAG: RecBCD enzyme subunit RecD [Chlamydiae bacterium]|nr:RecBCD enzyme subunit RecD [Chlamydiota bacterium]